MPICALFVSAVLLLYWSQLLLKVLSFLLYFFFLRYAVVASSLWLNLDKLHDTAPLINYPSATLQKCSNYRDMDCVKFSFSGNKGTVSPS